MTQSARIVKGQAKPSGVTADAAHRSTTKGERTLEAVIARLKRQHGLYRIDGHLVHRTAAGDQCLIKRFTVLGTARSTDGRVLGVILATADADRRSCIAPLACLREPRKLAEYFERIGIVPPTDLKALKLVATYVDVMARREERVVLSSEGIHAFFVGNAGTSVAVIDRRVIGSVDTKVLAIPDRASVYAAKGTLESWRSTFAPLIRGNPLLITSACFALTAPLGSLLNFKLMGLLLAGPSSIGKTTLARFVNSAFCAPGEPHQWAGTANGIEALAVRFQDLPLTLDELGSGELRRMLEVIYRISGGQTKARATVSGGLQDSVNIRSPIFATGEISLGQRAHASGTAVRAGHDVRMPTVWIDERYGVYSTIGDADDGAAFAERVNAGMRDHYGVLLPAFLEAVIGNLNAVRAEAAVMRRDIEAIVAQQDVSQMSGVERRVLSGFVNFAVAGELAVVHGLMPLKGGEPSEAVAHVFTKWLTRWRLASREPSEAPLRSVRDFFKRNARRFVPLKDWRDCGPAGFCGYVRTDKAGRSYYLVFREAFEKEVAAEHGVDATVQALRSAGLLVEDARGRMKLVRMPGVPKNSSTGRMVFFAISTEVAFDPEN